MSSGSQAPRDMREWLARLDERGMLLRIKEEVDLNEEMSGITYMVAQSDSSPTLLFENVKGYPGKSVAFNLIGSSLERFAMTLGLQENLSHLEMIQELRGKMKNRIAPKMVEPSQAPFYENSVIGKENIRVSDFPSPKHWPLDGGNYIGTADIVITRDPETGVVNMGTYRQMVHNDKEVGVMFSPGKDGRLHMQKYFAQGKPMPIVATWGVDPLMMLVGSSGYPKNDSELECAGGLIGRPIEVAEGKITGLPIPIGAEIVIEGYVHQDNMRFEGPFGEFTGYYGRPGEDAPVITIEAIHYRNNPISTAALMADYPACEQELFLSLMRAARLSDDFDRIGVPGIQGVYSFPQAAAGFGMTVVSLQQQYPGHAAQALAIAAQSPGAAYFTKWIIAVDEDVDPTDINQVLWAMSTRCNPIDDIDILRNTWSTWLDPSQNPPEKRPYGSKALINACKNHQYIKTYAKRTTMRRTVYDNIAARWNELGLPGKPPKMNSFHE